MYMVQQLKIHDKLLVLHDMVIWNNQKVTTLRLLTEKPDKTG